MKNLSNEVVIHKSGEGIEYLQFRKLLELGIKHAYTLKKYDVNFRTGSKEQEDSYKKICMEIGIDQKKITKPCQKHTNNIRYVSQPMKVEELLETDGLITDVEKLPLSTTNADCILIMFYDPKKKIIANIHSGWKGTQKRISEKLVKKLVEEFKCQTEDILCFICPSIRRCHFEVEDDVKQLFENEFNDLNKDDIINKGKMIEGKQKYYIDTVLLTKELLKLNGIREENIYDSNICSVCNSDQIRSYRVEKENYKLATAIIQLG